MAYDSVIHPYGFIIHIELATTIHGETDKRVGMFNCGRSKSGNGPCPS